MYHMSRATHDAECPNCHFQGTVGDEVIICPKCQRHMLYSWVSFGDLKDRIEARKANLPPQIAKPSQG